MNIIAYILMLVSSLNILSVNKNDLYLNIIRNNPAELDKLLREGGKNCINGKMSYGSGSEHSKRRLISIAADRGNLEIVRTLLKYKPNLSIPDSDGDTCIHRAVEKNYRDVCEVLLIGGAPTNMVNKNGHTALSSAARDGNISMMLLLLNFRAQFNVPNARSPLREAARNNQLDAYKFLLEQGANQHEKDQYTAGGAKASGNTVLSEHVMSIRMTYEGCKAILESNVDPNEPNNDGETAFALLLKMPYTHIKFLKILRPYEDAEYSYEKIILLFLEYGATVSRNFQDTTVLLKDNNEKRILHYGLQLKNDKMRKIFERMAAVMFFNPRAKRLKSSPLEEMAATHDHDAIAKLTKENDFKGPVLDSAALNCIIDGTHTPKDKFHTIQMLLSAGALTKPAGKNIVSRLINREYC